MKRTTKHLINAWAMIMIVAIIDLITTIKALRLGAEEMNPIATWFFSFGDFGYIYRLIFIGVFSLCMLIYSVKFCGWIYYKKRKKRMKDNLTILLYYIIAGCQVILELLVIRNNINVIQTIGG